MVPYRLKYAYGTARRACADQSAPGSREKDKRGFRKYSRRKYGRMCVPAQLRSRGSLKYNRTVLIIYTRERIKMRDKAIMRARRAARDGQIIATDR